MQGGELVASLFFLFQTMVRILRKDYSLEQFPSATKHSASLHLTPEA